MVRVMIKDRLRLTTNQSVDTSYKLVDALVASIRRRHIVGSRNAAIATATLIKNIVRHVKYSTVEELISIIKAIGKRLMDANPRGTHQIQFGPRWFAS